MLIIRRALLPVLMLATLLGCRKDKDEKAPRITILEPANGFTITVPDTFTVRVEVSDDRVVRSVTIALADVNGIPVAPPVQVEVGSASAIVVRDLVVADERLSSGTYTLMARASDGSNESSAFRSVQLTAAALRLRALYITPPFGAGPAPITRIDSAGNMSTVTTMQDLNGAAIDGHGQHLVLAGGAQAPLVALPTASGSGSWQQPNLNALALPYFSGLKVDPADGRVYFSTNDGFIRGFTGSGAQTFTAQASMGFRGMATAVVGERLVSIQRSISLPESRLVTYALASGASLGQFELDLELLDLHARTGQHVLLFGNLDGNGIILDRNVVQGGGSVLREFAGTPIRAVVRLDANTWVIALPGQLVRWSQASNGLVLLAQGLDVRTLAHDMATGTLYAGTEDQLIDLDPLTGTITGTRSMTGGVGSILPLLNR